MKEGYAVIEREMLLSIDTLSSYYVPIRDHLSRYQCS